MHTVRSWLRLDLVWSAQQPWRMLVKRSSTVTSFSGIIMCTCPANERRPYNVTSFLIGWAHAQKGPCIFYETYCILTQQRYQAWMNNHMPNEVWDEITYPFPNFNGWTVEVWEWIINFIPHFIMGAITYPCPDGCAKCDWIQIDAHVTTAPLSCHEQNFVAITL